MISIIVPIFNAENTLEECIKSILCQTFKDFELILVNDGSMDGSLGICEKYSRLDDRIRIIDKLNEGPGKARNEALKVASGSYVGFVDSDDVIEPSMFSVMLSLALEYNADIVQCGHEKVDQDGNVLFQTRYQELVINNSEKCFKEYCNQKNVDNYSPTKIYRREIINNVRFGDLCYSEDAVFIMQAFLNCKSLVVINSPFYKYIQTPNSACRSAFNYKYLDTIKAGEFMFKTCELIYPKFVSYFAIYTAKWARYCFCHVCNDDYELSKNLLKIFATYYKKIRFKYWFNSLYVSLSIFRYCRKLYLFIWN